MSKILHDREMISSDKRDKLKELGLIQYYFHNTHYFSPEVNYEDIELIPSNIFFSEDDKYQIVVGTPFDEDKFIIMEKDSNDYTPIDDYMYYNWADGYKRLKELLNK